MRSIRNTLYENVRRKRSPIRWRKELRFENDWKPAERPLSILNAKLPNFIPRCLDSISSSGKSLEQVKMGVNRGDRCSHASGCKTSMSRWAMHPEHVIFKGNYCVHCPLISGYGPMSNLSNICVYSPGSSFFTFSIFPSNIFVKLRIV